MPDKIPQELLEDILARLTKVLTDPAHRIEDLYASEQSELVEPESHTAGNGNPPLPPYPTGVRRLQLYLRYVVLEEEKAHKAKLQEEA